MSDIVRTEVSELSDGIDHGTPMPGPEPTPRIERTLLRETFMRARRFGKLMVGEGLEVWMVCPQCRSAVGVVADGLLCKCSHWMVR
jgi:hypothetical protein